MPPKPKFTREQVIDAAYELTVESGIDAVVAREVAKKLNTTTTPIFTYFETMDQLRDEVREKASKVCTDYLKESLNYYPAFKEFGLRWIRFSQAYPNLYSLLFMIKGMEKNSSGLVNGEFNFLRDEMKTEAMKTFGISREDADGLFETMSIYAQGIACMYTAGVDVFDEETLSRKFSGVCLSYVAGCKICDESINIGMFKSMLEGKNMLPKLKCES